MRLHFEIEHNSATPRLLSIQESLGRKIPLNRAIAEGASKAVLANFRELARTNHNKLGASPTLGFWQKMQFGTFADADQDYGYVRMPREVALRYFGGTVTPKMADYLAIPARTEAYNKSPRDFSDLRLIFFTKPDGSKTMALAEIDQQALTWRKSRKGVKKGEGRAGFLLACAKRNDRG